MNIPAALTGEKTTPTDKAMGDLVSAYWVQFGLTGDPNGSERPNWPRYDPCGGSPFPLHQFRADTSNCGSRLDASILANRRRRSDGHQHLVNALHRDAGKRR